MAEYDANECVRCNHPIDLLFPEDTLFGWYKYGICTVCWSEERDSIKPFYMFDYTFAGTSKNTGILDNGKSKRK